jgi:hypothetical protein
MRSEKCNMTVSLHCGSARQITGVQLHSGVLKKGSEKERRPGIPPERQRQRQLAGVGNDGRLYRALPAPQKY